MHGEVEVRLLFAIFYCSRLMFTQILQVGGPIIQNSRAIETVSQHNTLPINRIILSSIARHTVSVVCGRCLALNCVAWGTP